jgi:hypothetical protein
VDRGRALGDESSGEEPSWGCPDQAAGALVPSQGLPSEGGWPGAVAASGSSRRTSGSSVVLPGILNMDGKILMSRCRLRFRSEEHEGDQDLN